MTAIAAALERGRAAAPKKGTKWEPVDVTYRGQLVAVLRNTETDQLEGVYRFKSQVLHHQLGRLADGTITVHGVRDRTLRKMADAMIGDDDERPALVAEAWERMKEKMAGQPKEPRKVKRASRGRKKK